MARKNSHKKRFFIFDILADKIRQRKKNRKEKRLQKQKEKAVNKISGKFMNNLVVLEFIAAFVFTIVMITVFVKTGSEPSTLEENVFQFLSVEGGAMALIKVTKVRSNRNSDQVIDETKCADNNESEEEEQG